MSTHHVSGITLGIEEMWHKKSPDMVPTFMELIVLLEEIHMAQTNNNVYMHLW